MHDDPPGPTVPQRVLAALLANRTPGWNFAGRFLGIEYLVVHERNTLCHCGSRPELLTARGQTDPSVLGVVCDLALAASARPRVGASIRLATVGMSIHLVRPLGAAALSARSRLLRHDVDSGLVTATLDLHGGGERLGVATATFLAMQSPTALAPVPMRARAPTGAAAAAAELTPAEQAVADRAHAALASGPGGFLQRFWGPCLTETADGAEGRFETGLHAGNRVGHVQGGLLMGLAIATAQAAAGDDHELGAVHTSYVRPGRTARLALHGRRLHRGSTTAGVAVTIADEEGSVLVSSLVEFRRRRDA